MNITLNGFTPFELQKALQEELRELLGSMQLKKTNGCNSSVDVRIQALPEPTAEDSSDIDPFPYVIIRLSEGDTNSLTGEEPKKLLFYIILGVYNDDPERTGYIELLSLIQKIETRFSKNHYIGNFECTSFSFVLGDEDTHPYYNAVEIMTFNAPTPVVVDPYS